MIHWRAVWIFFSFFLVYGIDRSFWRCAFGMDQVLQEDSPEAYGPRVDRKTVADKVLERLQLGGTEYWKFHITGWGQYD